MWGEGGVQPFFLAMTNFPTTFTWESSHMVPSVGWSIPAPKPPGPSATAVNIGGEGPRRGLLLLVHLCNSYSSAHPREF